MEKNKLFVGNLNFETTEEEVRNLFSAHGTVKSIRLSQKKGTAFIEMSTPEEAAVVIDRLDKSDFKDRPVRISLELSKKKAKALTRARRDDRPKKKSSKKK